MKRHMLGIAGAIAAACVLAGAAATGTPNARDDARRDLRLFGEMVVAVVMVMCLGRFKGRICDGPGGRCRCGPGWAGDTAR